MQNIMQISAKNFSALQLVAFTAGVTGSSNSVYSKMRYCCGPGYSKYAMKRMRLTGIFIFGLRSRTNSGRLPPARIQGRRALPKVGISGAPPCRISGWRAMQVIFISMAYVIRPGPGICRSGMQAAAGVLLFPVGGVFACVLRVSAHVN